jgi:hypothetical protein
MNETNEAQDETTVDETVADSDVIAADVSELQKAADDLIDLLYQQTQSVTTIKSLIRNDTFKNLSKPGRVELLQEILTQASEIEDSSKGLFRLAKRVKRERITDEVTDKILFAQAYLY